MKACLLVFFFFVSHSACADLVVNERGEINGALNRTKESVLGESFWRDQLAQAKSELTNHLEAGQRKQKLDAAIQALNAKSRARQEDHYREYPKMRPTLAKQQADALREAADDIESAEMEVELEKFRNRRISTLQSIIKHIENR